MAPRTKGNGVKSLDPVSASTDNGQPPPSTLAAQIVQQHAADRNKKVEFSTFHQLLAEIRSNPLAVEDDVESNAKLIKVIVDAGLNQHAIHEALARMPNGEQQIVACLDVIQIVTNRTPSVLKQDIGSADAYLDLFIIRKLLDLSRVKLLRFSVRILALSLPLAATGKYDRGARSISTQAVLRAWASAIVKSLGEDRSEQYPTFPREVLLPSTSGLQASLARSPQQIAVTQGPGLHLRSLDHVAAVIILIFEVVLQRGQKTSLGLSSACQVAKCDNELWILSLCSSLWQYLKAGKAADSPAAACLLLKYLLSLLRTGRLMQFSNFMENRLCDLTIQCVRDSLTISSLWTFPNLRRHCLQAIRTIITAGANAVVIQQRAHSLLMQPIRERLQAHAEPSAKDADFWSSFQQVFYDLTTFESERTCLTKEHNLDLDVQQRPRNIPQRMTPAVPQAIDIDHIELERPAKRRRVVGQILDGSATETKSDHLQSICAKFDNWKTTEFRTLTQTASELYADLEVSERLLVLRLLGDMHCANTSKHGAVQDSLKSTLCCYQCGQVASKRSQETRIPEYEEERLCLAQEMLTRLAESNAVQSSKGLRVVAIQSIGQATAHAHAANRLDLNTSSAGKLCLQGLRSSSREVRLAAGHTLAMFLRSDTGHDEQLCHQNRITLFNFLRSFTQAKDARTAETVILTLGQIAFVCGDEEMNLILLQLLEFLGDSNPYICGLAHLEIRRLAQISDISVEDLIRPFWRSLAITVVKDVVTNPQKTQQLSDLLGCSVAHLLRSSQSHTVPYLLLWGHLDVLKRIATAQDSGSTPWDICIDPDNLTAILPLLVTQHPDNADVATVEILRRVNPDFAIGDVDALFKAEIIAVARETLKIGGEADQTHRAQVHKGFTAFASIVERRGHATRTVATQTRMTSLFFENHALGIMASFSDTVESPAQPYVEKRRCLRAIKLMIEIGRKDVAMTIPQIRACLQSALDVPELCCTAFDVWTALLGVAEAEDLESLICQTFSIIALTWESFDSVTQSKAHDVLSELLHNYGSLIQDMAESIPSIAAIPVMSKFENQLSKLRNQVDVGQRLKAFVRRCAEENALLVLGALNELLPYLEENQQWIHDSASSEHPAPVLSELIRALLDSCARFNDNEYSISQLSGRCLGVIGCLDTNRVENLREQSEALVMLSNFSQAAEAVEFVIFTLENVLAKAFHSVSNPRAQGFLAYVMQELLKFCGFNKDVARAYRPQGTQADEIYQRWIKLPELIRNTLTPFLSSRYVLTTNMSSPGVGKRYPLYSTRKSHASWVRDFTFDILQNGNGANAKMIFNVLARIIRGYDVQIASFLLPYAAANIIIDGSGDERTSIVKELATVMKQPMLDLPSSQVENLKHCSENVFQILDYLSRWLQEKRKSLAAARNLADRSGRPMDANEESKAEQQILNVESTYNLIPADILSTRALECKSYARALQHWEEHMRKQTDRTLSPHADDDEREAMYRTLQMIYTMIDEPDGLEGVSSHLQMLSPQQQALQHQRAGRWSAAQSWYELQLKGNPNNLQLHAGLLSCLRDAAQFPMIIKHATTANAIVSQDSSLMGTAARAAWSAQDWKALDAFVSPTDRQVTINFDIGVAAAIQALRQSDEASFSATIEETRSSIVKSMTGSTIDSLQACREQLLKLHILHEMQVLGLRKNGTASEATKTDNMMSKRLEILGSSIPDKQYLLGIRRAIMQVSNDHDDSRLAGSWMTSVKLARKALPTSLAYDALFQASKLGEESSAIEHARLLWGDGEQRKAIQSLQGAIVAKTFAGANDPHTSAATGLSTSTLSFSNATTDKPQQNLLVARAHLLLAKWLDQAGQTQWDSTLTRYRQATLSWNKWEKGLYNLGKFYNKLYDSEKALPLGRQSLRYVSGETAKLVIENYLRSLTFGCKYLFQTLPKLLTLWLDMGDQVGRTISREISDDVRNKALESRLRIMEMINKQMKKYAEKIWAYLFYTALPQMITRVTHQNSKVWEILSAIITKVVAAHPQQALWSLLAVVKAKDMSRSRRGAELLNRLKERSNKVVRNEGQSVDLKDLVTRGQRMSEELINACDAVIEGRVTIISLTKTLGFRTKCAPCPLVIPLEKTLFASLPMVHSGISLRNHKPFPATREAVTISSFDDNVLVLASLQKPRKITIKGSDGRRYGLLCKPNDDLRKDQRLMEYNAMINRGLKKDAASSARRLYIKTYAVTPLNEACGLIEWVEGLKPLRDILLASYKSKGTKVDYALLKELLTDACKNPPESTKLFTETILSMYRPLLHEWFTELFSVPDAWYAARTRYARSCAVASMVGYSLGLGDRHGENVLLEEKTGGVFHVDFNCLFDKGLTFEKPELVPFRLTHNMVDAMGATGVEGTFRRAAECAMGVMRQQEDALLTILETFVYDPTADFMGPRRKVVKGVPDSPKEVLESVRGKVRGMMTGETLALSVQGHVDALIRQATDPARLAAMYIGWCAFL